MTLEKARRLSRCIATHYVEHDKATSELSLFGGLVECLGGDYLEYVFI